MVIKRKTTILIVDPHEGFVDQKTSTTTAVATTAKTTLTSTPITACRCISHSYHRLYHTPTMIDVELDLAVHVDASVVPEAVAQTEKHVTVAVDDWPPLVDEVMSEIVAGMNITAILVMGKA